MFAEKCPSDRLPTHSTIQGRQTESVDSLSLMANQCQRPEDLFAQRGIPSSGRINSQLVGQIIHAEPEEIKGTKEEN